MPGNHDYRAGDPVVFKVEGAGVLDTALTANTKYFVVDVNKTSIAVSSTKGGVPIALAGAGGQAGSGIGTLTAATAYDALKHGPEMLATYGATPLLIGFGAAWLSAVLAVKWMVGYLKSHGMEIFGWYRVALALVVAAWLLWPST